MSQQEDKICEAVETLVNRQIDLASFDKTTEATIVRCENSRLGEQTVFCYGENITAYASPSEIPLFQPNERVLVLSSNSLNNKYIISAPVNNTSSSNEGNYPLPITSIIITSNTDFKVTTRKGTEWYTATLENAGGGGTTI